MVKKFIAISAIALVMTGGAQPSAASSRTSAVVQQYTYEVPQDKYVSVASLKHIADMKQHAFLQGNTDRINAVISQLKKRIGKTWYVFSGDTPSGWDCSGLVMWAYEQLNIDVPHSANKQGHLAVGVKDPKPGDIVVWAYGKSTSYYHAAIYIGNGKAIHAGFRKGMSTQVISLDSASFKGSTPKFVRLIDSL